ncbi:proline oxidase-like protein [Phyllosticta capitalensis]
MVSRTVQAYRLSPAHRQRLLHASAVRRIRLRVYTGSPISFPPTLPPQTPDLPQHVLAFLPFSQIVKTYLITLALSNPILYHLCFSALHLLAYPPHPVLDPDKNRALGYLLKKTFYSQFCAGENKAEVEKTAAKVRSVGYDGLSLEFALEVLLDEIESSEHETPEETAKAIETWRNGMLQTVEMVREGEFAALKWSGLGRHALHLLKHNQPPTPAMADALDAVCSLASRRRVSLLPGAEEEITNPGIDKWTLALMAKYNRAPYSEPAQPVMYNTYQAYLRSTPAKLAQHLRLARDQDFAIGVKLVRGAYMASEPPGAIWATKEQTDAAYDGLAAELLGRKCGEWLQMGPQGSAGEAWPQLALVLATHNITSVRRAQALRNRLLVTTPPSFSPTPLAFAQLQGMADEVGFDVAPQGQMQVDVPRAFKNIVWGTPGECLQFLLRRAQENRDAVGRTEGTRKAMGQEMVRRLRLRVRTLGRRSGKI